MSEYTREAVGVLDRCHGLRIAAGSSPARLASQQADLVVLEVLRRVVELQDDAVSDLEALQCRTAVTAALCAAASGDGPSSRRFPYTRGVLRRRFPWLMSDNYFCRRRRRADGRVTTEKLTTPRPSAGGGRWSPTGRSVYSGASAWKDRAWKLPQPRQG